MSQFMPEERKEEKVQIPDKGPVDYLSQQEREFLHRLLSFPEDLPPKFKSWLTENEAVNGGKIPASRIVGLEP